MDPFLLCYLCFVSVMLSCLFTAALSPTWKGLTKGLWYVMFSCVLSLSNVVSWGHVCGTCLYYFLIFAFFFTSTKNAMYEYSSTNRS